MQKKSGVRVQLGGWSGAGEGGGLVGGEGWLVVRLWVGGGVGDVNQE